MWVKKMPAWHRTGAGNPTASRQAVLALGSRGASPRQAATSQPASFSAAAPPQRSFKDAQKLLDKGKGEYLYRAMTADGSDFLSHPVSLGVYKGKALVERILRVVEMGNRVRSPLLHFSWDVVVARSWVIRGRTDDRVHGTHQGFRLEGHGGEVLGGFEPRRRRHQCHSRVHVRLVNPRSDPCLLGKVGYFHFG